MIDVEDKPSEFFEMADTNAPRQLNLQITDDPVTGKKYVLFNGKMMPLVSIGMPVKVMTPESLPSTPPPPPSKATPLPPKTQPRRPKRKRVQVTEVLRNLRVDNKLLTKDLARSESEVRALKRELVKAKSKCSTLRKELLRTRTQLAQTRRRLNAVDGNKGRPEEPKATPMVLVQPEMETATSSVWELSKDFYEPVNGRVEAQMMTFRGTSSTVPTKPELHSDDSMLSISTEIEQSYLGPYPSGTPSQLTKWRLLMCLQKCNVLDDNGDYPIHLAVMNDIHAVRRQCAGLKFRGIPVDLENHEGYTPLQLAVMCHVDVLIVEELIKFGADLCKVDKAGNNIFHLATSSNYLHILEERNLLKGPNVDSLVDSYNYKGLTPLMLAAMKDHGEDAEVLLKRNANVDLQDKVFGRTALFHAVENKSIKMVELLLNYDADKKSRNFLGLNILDALVDMEVPKSILTLLTAKKEDLSAKRSRKRYPADTKLKMVSKKVNIHSLLR